MPIARVRRIETVPAKDDLEFSDLGQRLLELAPQPDLVQGRHSRRVASQPFLAGLQNSFDQR
jgi:hypothetical protein